MSGDGRTPGEEGIEATRGDEASRFSDLSAHFYRAEVDRMTVWRTRLDQTTRWAVVVLAAILTWAFSSPENPHYVLLVGALATIAFLLVEAQRYQEYDAWRSRVRLLQEVLFAQIFDSDGEEHHDRSERLGDELHEHLGDEHHERLERLGEDLRDPSIRMPYWQAVGHRLSRIYLALLTIILAAWTARVTVFVRDTPPVRAAAIEDIPGVIVIAVVAVVYLGALGLALWSFTRAPRREFSGGADVARADEEA